VLKQPFLFASGTTGYNQVINECVDENDERMSTETVSDWFSYICEIQLYALVPDTKSQIGGENCTVEVDEAKLGKRKYNHRRL
jgi:hypothetical protein